MAYQYIEDSAELRVGGTLRWTNKDGEKVKSTAWANLSISTNGETVNWTIKMDSLSSNKPFIYLYLSIGGVKVLDKYYDGKATEFPRYNGATTSGTVAIDATASQIPVELRVGPSTWIWDYTFGGSTTLNRTVYSPGNTGTLDGIKDSENNSVNLWGTIGGTSYNNDFREAIIHYTLDGTDPKSSKNVKQKIIVQRTEEDILLNKDYPSLYNINIPVTKDCPIQAYLECKFTYDTTKTSTKSADDKILYHTNMTGTPFITIRPHDDNTFTIEAKGCGNGDHNNVETKVYWGYSTKYEKEPEEGAALTLKKSLEVTDSTKDTKMVYAKVTSIPDWKHDENYNNGAGISKTTSLAIPQYVAPSKPGIPDLKVKKRRVTIKEPWTITWKPAEAVNNNSPVKGYYIMVLRKADGSSSFEYVRELRALTGNYIAISKGSNSDNNTNYFIKRPGTSCTAIIRDPASLGFVPGDEVVFRIKSYTENAAGKVWQLEGQAGASDSRSYQVRNAGIVHVNVPGSDTSVEGQVWIKAEGEWHEAESVCVKDEGIWHESQ